jgi:hypothetical protein
VGRLAGIVVVVEQDDDWVIDGNDPGWGLLRLHLSYAQQGCVNSDDGSGQSRDSGASKRRILL